MEKRKYNKLDFTKAKLAYFKKMKDRCKPIKNQKIMKNNKKKKNLELNKKAVSDLQEKALNGGLADSNISFPLAACSFPEDACKRIRER